MLNVSLMLRSSQVSTILAKIFELETAVLPMPDIETAHRERLSNGGDAG
jgi:hypothetical protein